MRAIMKIEGFDMVIEIKRIESEGELRLGRDLFFDARVSRGGAMSCSTCHKPELAFSDGLPRARGRGGKELQRNTPSLYNVTISEPYIRGFFLDGRAKTLEEVVLAVIQNPLEFDNKLPDLVADLGRIPDYDRRFRELYGPAGLTDANVGKVIAAYVRSLAPTRPSPYDRVHEDWGALTLSQKRGLLLFAGKAKCVNCHWTPEFTSGQFLDTGHAQPPGAEDAGRYAVTHSASDRRAFKMPSLRNVALTAPYMHDGRIKTLTGVIEFYDRGGDGERTVGSLIQPLGLTAQDKLDLEAFLRSLTNPYVPDDRSSKAPAGPAPSVAAAPASKPSYYEDSPRAAPAAAPPSDAADPCLKSGSPEASVADLARRRPLDDASARDVVDFFKYRAFREGNPGLCDGLKSEADPVALYSQVYYCKNWYVEMTLLHGMMTKRADFPKVCRQVASFDPGASAQAEPLCSLMAASLDDPPAMCPKLLPRFLYPNWVRACGYLFSAVKGDAVACEPFEENPSQIALCKTLNAFTRAYRAKDPALCGGLEPCEVLMGRGAAVGARVAARIKAKACAATSKSL
jgi:cytochrome c peroxidase